MAFGFINPEDLPPEMLEHIRQHQDQADMTAESYSNSVFHFLDSLDAEGLRTLNLMLHQIASGSGSILAAFYEGQVQMLMKSKHNVCPVHGVNHADEALQDMLKDTETERNLDPEDAAAIDATATEEEKARYLAEYSLTEVVNPSTNLPQFVCKCGMVYPSLADRMMKDVDDCPGCIHKTQWG